MSVLKDFGMEMFLILNSNHAAPSLSVHTSSYPNVTVVGKLQSDSVTQPMNLSAVSNFINTLNDKSWECSFLS